MFTPWNRNNPSFTSVRKQHFKQHPVITSTTNDNAGFHHKADVQKGQGMQKIDALHIHLSYCATVRFTSIMYPIEITMQGVSRGRDIHSGLITWTSHPIKDISGVLAGLSNSAACSDMFRQAFDTSERLKSL